jgi:hypothetical protein
MRVNDASNPGDAAWEDIDGGREAPKNPVLLEHEARRCQLCQGKYPAFGFAHPLAKKRQTIWACFEHWAAVNRMLTGDQTWHEKAGPTGLL